MKYTDQIDNLKADLSKCEKLIEIAIAYNMLMEVDRLNDLIFSLRRKLKVLCDDQEPNIKKAYCLIRTEIINLESKYGVGK